MRYYKLVNEERLSAIGVGSGGIEITEVEYNHVKSIIDNRPTAPEGYAYRLTVGLEWELYELPVVEDEDISVETN